jgi:hypothetical protein
MTDGSGTYQKINTGITDWTKGVTTANSTAISSVGTVTTGTWNGNTISPLYGGTGLTSYATGDLLYASATNVLSKLTIGTVGQVLTVAGGLPTWATGGGGGSGTVTSVAALTLGTTGTDVSSTVANSTTTPVITLNIPTASALNRGALSSTDWSTFNGKQAVLSGTGLVKSTAGTISYITDNSTNWDTAFSQRLQWDGGATGLVAATGRTSLGATTVGGNLFTATNPSAITFIRANADNTVSFLDAATFRTAIGAGTSSTTGTVTSVAAGTNLTGGTITTTGTIALATTLTGLTSVTSTTFVGALTGNASTATTLQTARTINGTSFNGSANITVTAAAGTLTGTTLNATVVSSSLTSVGTITTGVWTGTTIAIANGGTGATTANAALNNLLPSQTGNSGKYITTDGINASWVAIVGSAGGTVTSVSGSGGTTGLTLTGGPITASGTLTLGGTLAIANGGTGATTALAAFNALSPLTTKGDLLTRDATNNIRVPVGTNGQVLLADSTVAAGVKWANASSIAGQTIRFLSANTANSNTVANTFIETNFAGSSTNYAMPANTPNANSLLRFLVYGRFSTKNGTVGTLTIRLKLGSTSYVANVINPGNNILNSGFQFTGQMQFRTIGASGTVYSHLQCVFDAAGASGSTTFVKSSLATAVVDTTIINTVQMSAQWSTADVDNTITIEQATFEILN